MRIYDIRKERGLTQQQVADALGLPLNTYRNYERNERQPPVEVLFKLADHYGVSLDYLMGRDTTPEELSKAQLLAMYEMLNDDGKAFLLAIARMTVTSGQYLPI